MAKSKFASIWKTAHHRVKKTEIWDSDISRFDMGYIDLVVCKVIASVM